MSADAITVATSIPPALSRRNAGQAIDAGYQQLCIRSWRECGFNVVSVNHPSEIPALARSYPDVTFIPAEQDARAISGRPTPYIADLLRALFDAPGPIAGIINSDIVFEPSTAWRGTLPRAAAGAAVTGQRYDATSLFDGTFRKYYWGFDYFFFDRNAAREIVESATPFAMGLAWWDYWLPAALSLKGRQILALERPAVAHLIHKEPHLDDGWRRLAMSFAHFIVQHAAASRGPLPSCVSAVLPLCRELVDMPELLWRNRGADAQISRIAVAFVPTIARNAASLTEGSEAQALPGEMVPSNVFRRFAERLSAGKTLERAKQDEREGRLREADRQYRHALERTPNDVDLLLAFGEFLLRKGDAREAADLLTRAIGADPENSAAPLSCAIALARSGQQEAASGVLTRALARWPDLVPARELLAKIKTAAQPPDFP
jgi:tetratricopeptide (TPR) repeat protein